MNRKTKIVLIFLAANFVVSSVENARENIALRKKLHAYEEEMLPVFRAYLVAQEKMQINREYKRILRNNQMFDL